MEAGTMTVVVVDENDLRSQLEGTSEAQESSESENSSHESLVEDSKSK